MPQMAPMNWLSIFITINLLMFLIIIFNYYMLLYKTQSKTPNKSVKPINWKW